MNIAINGFGRIGRHAFKIAYEKGLNIVAINDLTDTKTLAHLLKYDTAYPDFAHEVTYTDTSIVVDGQDIPAYAEKDPSNLPWKKCGVDIVLECTGLFRDKEKAFLHLTAGAKKVIISAPSKGDGVKGFVRGVNCESYAGEDIIDNASCTTNCAAPVMRVLETECGVEKAMLTTVHSYTASQNLQDGPNKDLREARAAAQNMVPTSTGAAIAVTKAIPSLHSKFDGLAVRVPTITVSLVDITAVLKKDVTKEELNDTFVRASQTYLKGILDVSFEPLVSSDYIGNEYSSTVDAALTNVVGGNMVKVVAWYDNEWGYAMRLVEMVERVGKSA